MLLAPCPGKFAVAFPEPGCASSSTRTTSEGVPLTFIQECEAGYILGRITISAMQDEAERLLSGTGMCDMGMSNFTKGRICIVEFQKRSTAPGRNSTIGNLALGDTVHVIIIRTSSLVT